jgi:prephenate dehydrogenase
VTRVCVVGGGLIGGSLTLALRARRPEWQLSVVERDPETRRRLESQGIATTARLTPDALQADLLVLALPLPALLDYIDSIISMTGSLGPALVITDVAGVKRPVLARAAALPASASFVGGHPMAGRETSGFGAADATLFEGRRVALCPRDGTAPEAVARVQELWAAAGATTLRCTADAHDEAVARVSHLPYFAAAAVATVAGDGDALAASLAASGLRDTTRVAWDATVRFAAAANPHVPARLREAAALLESWASSLERGDRPDEALDRAAAARQAIYPR